MIFRSMCALRRHFAGAAFLCLAGLALPREGLAQTDEERAGARAAAQEGARALREGRWSDAIDLFTRAESLVHAPPHLLYMARAKANSGLLVQAREDLLRVTREELAPNAPRAFRSAQEEARSDLKDLEARLPYITVNVQGAGTSRFAVTQDGVRIADALVGVPRPVNPGEHTFEATAEGLQGTATVKVAEGERQKVVIELKPAAVSAPAPSGPPPASEVSESPVGAPAPAASEPVEADTGAPMNGLRIGSYVAFGVGVVGLAAGTYFVLDASSKSSEADDLFKKHLCGMPAGCPDQQKRIVDLDDQASSARTLGVVGFVVGGVGLATGVTLFILSQDGDEAQSAAAPALRVTAGPSSVFLNGTF